MKSSLMNVFVAATMMALAVDATAQNTGTAAPKHTTVQKHPRKHVAQSGRSGKLSAGEAASLERTEAGQVSEDVREDNRGRLNSARLQHRPSAVSKAVYHAQRNVAAEKNVHQQSNTARLRTGELTTRQSGHVKTKETAVHDPIHSGREQERKLTSEDSSPPQAEKATEIHMKKHNARMF